MAVRLSTSRDISRAGPHDVWCSIGIADPGLDPARRLPDLAVRLNAAYSDVGAVWWKLGRELSQCASSALAHAPACASNASDFGQMLAWSALVSELAAGAGTCLVVCDDPWLFRHLASLSGVSGGVPPSLLPRRLALAVRGYAARLVATMRVLRARIQLRDHRTDAPSGDAVLLVYGHPTSRSDGFDGYFGELMCRMPMLRRVLHVDCSVERARALNGAGTTTSLHAWGSLGAVLLLPFAKWRPSRDQRRGTYGWLVARAAAVEGGTGSAAMIRWQQICQARWLSSACPAIVAWPWENHAWERSFVRRARMLGVRTVGYQHSVIGRHAFNYAWAGNADGLESIPDLIVANGPAGRRRLAALGYAPDCISMGGALRVGSFARLVHDASGPVFVALPFDADVGREMIEAIRPLGRKGFRFLVKVHPMTPLNFNDSEGVIRTVAPLDRQPPLALVVYAGTTVGLEALCGGLPVVRFVPRDKAIMDVLPDEVDVPSASAESLEASVHRPPNPSLLVASAVFDEPDWAVWDRLLAHAPRAAA